MVNAIQSCPTKKSSKLQDVDGRWAPRVLPTSWVLFASCGWSEWLRHLGPCCFEEFLKWRSGWEEPSEQAWYQWYVWCFCLMSLNWNFSSKNVHIQMTSGVGAFIGWIPLSFIQYLIWHSGSNPASFQKAQMRNIAEIDWNSMFENPQSFESVSTTSCWWSIVLQVIAFMCLGEDVTYPRWLFSVWACGGPQWLYMEETWTTEEVTIVRDVAVSRDIVKCVVFCSVSLHDLLI